MRVISPIWPYPFRDSFSPAYLCVVSGWLVHETTLCARKTTMAARNGYINMRTNTEHDVIAACG